MRALRTGKVKSTDGFRQRVLPRARQAKSTGKQVIFRYGVVKGTGEGIAGRGAQAGCPDKRVMMGQRCWAAPGAIEQRVISQSTGQGFQVPKERVKWQRATEKVTWCAKSDGGDQVEIQLLHLWLCTKVDRRLRR